MYLINATFVTSCKTTNVRALLTERCLRLCCSPFILRWGNLIQRTFHWCFQPNFGSFGYAVAEKKIVRNRPIKNKNCLWRPCLSTDRDEMCNLYRRPSIVASYKVSVHLAKQSEKRKFDQIGQLETIIVCGDHVC